MNLADLVARVGAFAPDKPALRFQRREGPAGLAVTTYGGLAERIARAAGMLRGRGVGAGDRVALLALNHPDALVLLYACARLGAMLVPLNWRLAAPEIAYILADCAPALVVAEPGFADLLPAAPPPRLGLDGDLGEATFDAMFDAAVAAAAPLASGPGELGSPVLVVYTSGTTGRPKGAVLAQSALHWNGVMSGHMHALTADDHVLTVLPFFHVGGLNIQTTPALHHGATVTIHPRFAPGATLAAIARDRPTLTVLVPATIAALVADPGWAAADLSSLRAVTTGSTYVPLDLVRAVEARGVPVLEVYGATETGPIAVHTRLGDRAPPGSAGLPGLACAMEVRDEGGRPVPPGTSGEVALRGPHLFQGYWNDPEASAVALREGWFLTGDVGILDAGGHLTVHDRRKNMIVSGGENVYPAEVERVLLAHPGVAECAVIGRPDPRWGEVPVAYVVARAGCAGDEAALEADLIAFARGELAGYKTPRAVRFVASLPRSALGKVQHFALRAAAQG